jgi:hypothetical protein
LQRGAIPPLAQKEINRLPLILWNSPTKIKSKKDKSAHDSENRSSCYNFFAKTAHISPTAAIFYLIVS